MESLPGKVDGNTLFIPSNMHRRPTGTCHSPQLPHSTVDTAHVRRYHTDMSHDTKSEASDPSGRFVLRIDPGLHGALRTAARAASMSLNEYCARKLASPGARPDPEASALIERAARLLGESLVGVVAFGSRVRREGGATSDFDVLLITEQRFPITRELYARWDGEPVLHWRGHEVEPHFVHLPPEGAVPSGTWAEVATDGLVLHERGWSVSERLADIRRMISAGLISRRLLHGQPYWVRPG